MSEDVSGVYVMTNTVTGEQYVGSSRHVRLRVRTHRVYLLRGIHPNDALQEAVDTHGWNAFHVALLEEAEPNELVGLENYYIRTFAPAYNRYHKPTGTAPQTITVSELAEITPRKRGRPPVHPGGYIKPPRKRISAIPVVSGVDHPCDSIRLVARAFDVDPSCIRRWARAGMLAAFVVGNAIIVDRESWQRLREKRREQQAQQGPTAKRRGRPKKAKSEESTG